VLWQRGVSAFIQQLAGHAKLEGIDWGTTAARDS